MRNKKEKEHQDSFYSTEADNIIKSPIQNLIRKSIISSLIKIQDNPNNKNILSLGCGNGEMELIAAKNFRHITGIDLSSSAIEIATTRANSKLISNTCFIEGDCLNLKQSNFEKRFDQIWLLGFLHHIDDIAQKNLLDSCKDLLTDDGVIISVDPNKKRFAGLFKFLVKKSVSKYQTPDEEELIPDKIASIYKEIGYTKIELSYIDFFIGPFSWVFPNHSKLIAKPLWFVDKLLVKLPLIRQFSSSFIIIAKQ